MSDKVTKEQALEFTHSLIARGLMTDCPEAINDQVAEAMNWNQESFDKMMSVVERHAVTAPRNFQLTKVSLVAPVKPSKPNFFKTLYNRFVIFLIGLCLKPISFLLKLAKPAQKEPIQLDEHRLGMALLEEELEDQKDLIGLADLNDFSESKMLLLNNIRNEHLKRSAILEARGYVGKIHRTSNVEEDFLYADQETDSKLLASLQREKEHNDLVRSLKEHWTEKYYEPNKEQWDIDHKVMIDRLAVISEEEDRANNSWRTETHSETIEKELDLKPGQDS